MSRRGGSDVLHQGYVRATGFYSPLEGTSGKSDLIELALLARLIQYLEASREGWVGYRARPPDRVDLRPLWNLNLACVYVQTYSRLVISVFALGNGCIYIFVC